MTAHAGFGEKVFRVQLTLEQAPSLNVYATKAMHWQKAKLAAEIDSAILQAMRFWPRWHAGFRLEGVIRKTKKGHVPGSRRVGGARRGVLVTRNSAREPDELSVDVIGGKLPIDRLVAAGVLVDDNRKWCERRPLWVPAHPKQGFVVVEVFDLTPPGAGA